MRWFRQLAGKLQGARAKVLLALTGLNLLLSCSIAIGLFYFLNAALMSELDGRLHTAARAIPYVLPANYIERTLQGESIGQAEYLKNLALLNRYAQQIGVEYLYVLAKRGSDVVYLADSAPPSEVAINKYGHFLQSYSDRFQTVRAALDSGKPYFGQIQDQYGDFRSIAMPIADRHGDFYILGADIRTIEVQAMQAALWQQSVLVGLIVFGGGAVLSWLLACQMTAPLRRFSSAVHRFAAGDFDVRMPVHRHDELGSLASAFNAMGDAISAREHLMRQLAFSDRLTGLPNRVKFAELLSAYLVKAPPWLAVVMIDLTDFRYINDAFGFDAGDRVLRTMSDRLSQLQPEHLKMVSRISGNSFALLLSATDESQAYAQIQLVENALSESLYLGEQKVNVAIRSGIAIYPLHADNAEGLLRHAEVAMFFAKRDRESSVLYDPSREENRLSQFTLLGDLREALCENHLVVYYQPKINVVTGLVGAAEALVRWQHPSRGWISPGLFIPFAEKTGKLRGITEWVLCEVVRQQLEWHK